ncbi:MAG: antibiotic biosynthesis monooxygenase [Alphaproteobacteria bacterium]|nr:antibiotic biosynthesis monooxygenase [Alphaproteobacteria bacterium]MCW5744063.1 antibiotic biosynthesis monooxygenase [Alphaproteobacteria bacterium]
MILITGSIAASAATLDEIRAQSVAHSRRSRSEDGCLHHAVHVDAEDPLRLVFVEHWRDRAAVLKHFADPGARGFVAAMRKLGATTTIEIFEASEIGVKGLSA